MTTVPFGGFEAPVIVSVSPSTSSSFASTSIAFAPESSTTVAVSSPATGASLTHSTPMDAVATFESASPSFAL
jgi:hypothetical protein